MRFQARFAMVVALAVALTSLAAPQAFGVKKKRFKVNVTMTYERNLTGTDRFYGEVSSTNPRCIRKAPVILESRSAPLEGGSTAPSPPPTPVGNGRADAAGNWQILYEVPSNSYKQYSVEVPKRKFKKGTVICTKGFLPEPTIILGPPA